MKKVYQSKRDRRRAKIRARLIGTVKRPRLVVFRSNKHIYSQLIDDGKGETLAAACEKDLAENSVPSGKLSVLSVSKTGRAKLIGQLLAQRALEKGIKKVIFDRAGYKYHGRVKALAEGAREGGLKF